MNPAEENAILSGKPMTLGASWHRASALALFLLAALIALASGLAGPTGASAKTPGVPQNRIWENSARMLQSRPIQVAQSLELQREKSIGRCDSALGDTLAMRSAIQRGIIGPEDNKALHAILHPLAVAQISADVSKGNPGPYSGAGVKATIRKILRNRKLVRQYPGFKQYLEQALRQLNQASK